MCLAKVKWRTLDKLQRQHPEVRDVHKLRAMDLFNIPETEVTEMQRNAGAVVNTAEVYGVDIDVSAAMLASQRNPLSRRAVSLDTWLPPDFTRMIPAVRI